MSSVFDAARAIFAALWPRRQRVPVSWNVCFLPLNCWQLQYSLSTAVKDQFCDLLPQCSAFIRCQLVDVAQNDENRTLRLTKSVTCETSFAMQGHTRKECQLPPH
jgi:hypothetical protein